MIPDGLLFRQPGRTNGEQSECRAGPDLPRGVAKAAGPLQLPFCALRDKTEVHVAVRPSVAVGVRAEEDHATQTRVHLLSGRKSCRGFRAASWREPTSACAPVNKARTATFEWSALALGVEVAISPTETKAHSANLTRPAACFRQKQIGPPIAGQGRCRLTRAQPGQRPATSSHARYQYCS